MLYLTLNEDRYGMEERMVMLNRAFEVKSGKAPLMHCPGEDLPQDTQQETSLLSQDLPISNDCCENLVK